ncbi:putative ABC transport system ATP-binding protein [Frankia sp. EI5c]|uniref:ABC transporter ATP-binding protein n=1 Tax=Frankia sp. EI5c TaxID=683316 RepID=UPI0007C2485F|nr:ABC transporter ATP-binding protein [Frankia sp. EI5c]OAA27161.1 putative ABC transport system ATP-binding protein [Frankia sp. EI5c]
MTSHPTPASPPAGHPTSHPTSAWPGRPAGHGPVLEVRELTRTYGAGAGGVAALSGVCAAFHRGTFTAVMGPSGSGKSTFLTCAAGLEPPTSGRVVIDGADITDWDEDSRTRLRRERIGFVFQSFHLMPYLSAAQNVGLPLRLAGRRPKPDRVRGLLERVGLGERAGHLPAAMSGGQRQRVAIARALVTDPAVILADEPTGALDTTTASSVLDLLRACVDELGQTVVMVTHDPVAAAYADRVLFLVDGRVAGSMSRPTAAAVAGQLARLDEWVA